MLRPLAYFHQHKTPLKFLNSTVFLYGITLFTNVITYRYIDPEYLGIWATFATFSTLATILRLGIVNGMNRELPFYLGKGEVKQAEKYAETTLAYTLFTIVLLICFGVALFSLYNFDKHGHLSDSYKYAALVFILTVVVEPYNAYLSGTFRTSDSFDKLSNIQNVTALFRIPTLLLVVFYGYNGFLLREAFMVVLGLILLHLYRPMPQIRPSFHMDSFISLFKIGINIFLVSYLGSFVDTFPRLYLIDCGTEYELGMFSPVMVILGIVYLIPNTIGSYLYPRMSFAYGKGENRLYFWKKIIKILLLSVAMGLLFVGVIMLFIDYVIVFFPKYTNAAPYIKIMSIGLLFLGYKVCSMLYVIFKLYAWMWISSIVNAVVTGISILLLNSIYTDKLIVASGSVVLTNVILFVFYISSVYYITHVPNK